MTLRINRNAAALFCALGLAACKGGGDEKTTTAELVAITATQSSVFANGANTVGLHVTSTGTGPITVTTDRGTFQDTGTTATSVPGASGDVVLVTCNAVATPSCAGVARVTARRPGTAAAATVTFGGMPACASDCAADAACADYPCSSATVPSGFCAAGACAVPPTVTVTPSSANALANGVNTVGVAVASSGGGPITVTTTRGTFPGGVQSAVVPGASGALVLTTCDTASSSTCAGTALLTATDRTGTSKTAQVTFGTVSLCSTDCSIDAVCTNRACASATVQRGFCLAGACAPPPTITVTPSRGAALANGVNTVELQVSTSGNGPVTVVTTRGTFANGASTAIINASAGNLVLTTCNTATSATCAGTAVITATDATGTSGTGQVTFGTASLCSSDCAVDAAACEFHACASATIRSGFCSAGACAPPPTVTVTPSRSTALANGVNSVNVQVSTSGSGPILVSTSRGTFPGGVTSTTVNGTSGALTLTTCNTATSATCAGTATITATDPTGTAGTGQVTFGTNALCAADCTVDVAACASRACSSPTQASGICISGTCSPIPVVTVTPSTTSVLADGANSVALAVSTTGATGPITVTTTRGTLTGGGTTAEVAGTSGNLTLTSCNSVGVQPGCAGSATVTATDPTGRSGTANIAFVDVDDGAAITVTPGRARIPADGTNTTPVVVRVTRNGAAAPGVDVSLGTTLGSLSATSATTGNDGTATVTLTAAASAGVATISAAMTSAPSVSAGTTVTMPALGAFQVVLTQYPVMGVRYSGYREANQITFQALDNGGQAYPSGLQVAFSHERLGDSYLGIAPDCLAGPPASCVATGVTDATGRVAVVLNSGRVAGVVSVSATATAGGATASGSAANLPIIGAKASGSHITVDCGRKNVPALTNDDCTNSQWVENVTCTATFADRFNNVLGVATLVTFASEAGAAGQPATTPAYDPTKAPTSQGNLGIATNIIRVNGGKLPRDVPPFAGERWVAHDLDGCGNGSNLVHNPRDGLVTIIATALGEEGFVDLNGNGQFDAGEPFIDMGEPYVDDNDNGRWDLGETFIDTNGNGTYDGPDGQWEASKVIWAETRVVYTGYLEQVVTTGNALSRFYSSGDAVPDPTAGSTFTVTSAPGSNTTEAHPVGVMDGNLNPLTSTTTFAFSTANGKVTAAFPLGAGVSRLDGLGMSFTQLYCDHPTSPTTCGNVCSTSPCYVVTNVGNCNLPARDGCAGFGYGTWGTVNVTGACNTASATTDWPDTLQLTATLAPVQRMVTISGICQDR
ncbi:MAG: hypothetical protein HZB56_06340 [Deltaproteobacteria bacterium]|nr:hypothetical protein [Deltaproteobacteria bacterium]